MSKGKTNNSERESEKEKRIMKCRKDIRNISNIIMEENGLNIDQQMAMLLFVTIEKVMDSLDLSTFALGCKATSILLEELIHSALDLKNESVQV